MVVGSIPTERTKLKISSFCLVFLIYISRRASKLLCLRGGGIEDLELVFLNFNLKIREGCTDPVRIDKRIHGPPSGH